MEFFQIPYTTILVIFFCLGYLCIVFEHNLKIEKAASALLLGVCCWLIQFYFTTIPYSENIKGLSEYIWEICQILLFLLGAMALVEVIDSHNGFKVITNRIASKSKRKMLLIVSFTTFFLSPMLDNLTTAILMITLLRKMVPAQDRFIPGAMVVVAANAGGAWSPIGDVTTTMLWIKDLISAWGVIKGVFIPSLISMLVPLGFFLLIYKGKYSFEKRALENEQKKEEKGARLVLIIGALGLIFVPIFKALTGLPPFMGILFSLGVLWGITDLFHNTKRMHLRLPQILARVDMSVILFFLGILLAVDALQFSGILGRLSNFFNEHVPNVTILVTLIGLFSSIVDNVPLVAAIIHMYPITQVATDADLWRLLAYSAGTGGSILIIGSAAGIAFMGMEKINFFSYMKKVSIPVILGYLLGIVFYIIL